MALDAVAKTWLISEMGETMADLKEKAESEIHELLNSGKIYPEDVAGLRKYINALEEILEEGNVPKYGDSYDYSKPKPTKKATKKATKQTTKKATKK